MTYEEALAYVSSLRSRGWRMGLERMESAVQLLGLEQYIGGEQAKFIHVAGTNGKGSTTTFVQSLLIAKGFSTGGYFSPYVVDPRERIQLQGELISREDFSATVEEVQRKLLPLETSEMGGASEFEFKTAVAFSIWRRRNIEWIALETGLGGRLDATNVVTPMASVITSIGLDHQAILGGTVERIAAEKAGIVKAGKPVLVGDLPRECKAVVKRVADDKGSEFFAMGEDLKMGSDSRSFSSPWGEWLLPEPALIKGVKQPENLALAVSSVSAAGIKVGQSDIDFAARTAFAPARFQRVEWNGKPLIVDGAHNGQSALALVEGLTQLYPGKKFTFIANMVAGHELSEFLKPIMPIANLFFVPPIASSRGASAKEMVSFLEENGSRAIECESIKEALENSIVNSESSPVVVSGSFYLAGEVLNLVQANPLIAYS